VHFFDFVEQFFIELDREHNFDFFSLIIDDVAQVCFRLPVLFAFIAMLVIPALLRTPINQVVGLVRFNTYCSVV